MGFGEEGKMAFISGERGNKVQNLREQGNKDNTGNIRKQFFNFGGKGEQANLCHGTRELVSPCEGLSNGPKSA